MNLSEAALIGALVYAGMNFLKYIRAKDVNAIVTQAGAWLLGIGVVFLCSTADVTSRFKFNGIFLADLDGGSKVILGLMAVSLFATVPHQFIKAFDNTDSARTPALIPPAPVVTAAGEAVQPPG